MQLAFRLKTIVKTLFTKHLYLTNTSLAIMFLGAGDVIQQTIEHKMFNKVYESKRTGNMMVSGIFLGSLGHYWYKFLDTRFPGSQTKAVCKKLVAEMVVGPPFLFGFFVAVGSMEGKPVQKSLNEFKKNIVLILTADWLVYAPLQAVNFLFVLPKYRFLYVCTLSLVYDVFLSYVIHKEDNKRLQEDDEKADLYKLS